MKRYRALDRMGVTLAEIRDRYQAETGQDLTPSAITKIMRGESRSLALEEFIELQILGAPRFSLWPNGD
jgi:hypothetical protein